MITNEVSVAAEVDFLAGVHQPGDQYRCALYRKSAKLSGAVTEYTPEGEVSAEGYVPGGELLTGFKVEVGKDGGVLRFDNPQWVPCSIVAAGALIYNASKGNRALCTLRFEREVGVINGLFVVDLPRDGVVSFKRKK